MAYAGRGQRRKVTWMVPLSAVSLVTVKSLSSILSLNPWTGCL